MKEWKEVFKDIGMGIWAALMLAGTYAKDWWDGSNKKSKIIAGCVLGAVLLFGYASCVRAHEATLASGFGLITIDGTIFVCYVEDGEVNPGELYLCLIGRSVAPGLVGFNGAAVYCASTRTDDSGQYVYDCGMYKEMRAKVDAAII